MQKTFIGGFIQRHMVVICIWYALFVTSQFDVIFTFPSQQFGKICWHNRHILLHGLCLFYVSLDWYKLSALQVRTSEENKLSATTHQFITAKISGCVLKQGSKTHSSLGQSSLQETSITKNFQVRKKTFNFLLCTEVQQPFSFPFSLLRHYQMPECFYVNNCCFWARATVLTCCRNW